MGPSTETTELFRLVTDAPMLRVHNTDDTRDKTPAQPSWKMGDLDEAGFTAALDASNLGLAIKLGGKAGLIDIEGDGPGAELEWRDLTGGMVVPQTAGWESRRGVHQLFRLTPETRRIVGEGIIKPGDLEFRLGSEKSYDLYSIIPSEGDDRKWINGPEISTLPLELAKRISRLRVSSSQPSEGQGVDDRTPDPDSPGSLFNEQVTWSELLLADGWTHAGSRQEGTIDWRRPPYGEPTKQDISADTGYCGDKLYVWTTSVPGLEALGTYSKFAYFAYTQHGGDFSSAARDLVTQGYVPAYADPFDDLETTECDIEEDIVEDLKKVPLELLQFPGFVADASKWHGQRHFQKDYRAGAIAAISYQALLASRRVRMADNTRANLFTMMIGPSTCGKTSAVHSMDDIMVAAGYDGHRVEDFKSHQAMQDLVGEMPTFLSVQEEAQNMLMTMGDKRDKIGQGITRELKKLATAAKSIYRGRSGLTKDGGKGISVDQPHVNLLWTGITNQVWANLTTDQMDDGFVGRFTIYEIEKEDLNDNPFDDDLLFTKLVAHARNWTMVRPPHADAPMAAEEESPTIGTVQPYVLHRTPEAEKLAQAFKLSCHEKSQRADKANDPAASAWGRMSEQACRYELIIAASASHKLEDIMAEQTQRAIDLVLAMNTVKTSRMAERPIASNQFTDNCSRLTELVKKFAGKKSGRAPYSLVLNRFRLSARVMDEILFNLEEQEVLFTDRVFDRYGSTVKHHKSFICLWKNRGEATKRIPKRKV